jgi:hypothetical protein
MPKPNFFLVGAPKASTTSLFHQLRQHPEIYMSPIKEPCYFSFEVRPENFAPEQRVRALRVIEETRARLRGPLDLATQPVSGGIVTEWDDYLRLFSAATEQRAIGEASVGYMVSPHAAGAIAKRFPQARIIMVLRSPADRAFSQYLHMLSEGFITEPFCQFVRSCLRRGDEGLGVHRPFLEMGLYAAQVQRYLDCFPRSQIGIWIYEEHLDHRHEFLRQIFRFLDVDEDFQPNLSARYHQPRVPKMARASGALQRARTTAFSRKLMPARLRTTVRDAFYRAPGATKMEAADRRLMLEFYASDIRKLEGILNRDLSAWLL